MALILCMNQCIAEFEFDIPIDGKTLKTMQWLSEFAVNDFDILLHKMLCTGSLL